ncbi:heavy-metal-associated domain-containing protein [Kribbella sp. NPDC051718]|uniref:heavy-metal-associated domain-containing protein n=1 Tax=Kribbella sp. NPDC051718 TaxID=3155168 RepID=UPI003449F0FC
MLPDVAHYDRSAAAQLLARVLADVDLQPDLPASPYRVEPELTPLTPAPGSHLTRAQLSYLEDGMRPCRPELVTSASHGVMWHDSDGVLNVGHCGPGGFGPIVAIAARETVLVLRRALAKATVEELDADELAVMAATTTDRDPVEIFSVGLETTARALVQHAYLAERTSYRSPGEFARGLRDSGLFAVVANTWFWGLQSSTFRRGMIPVALAEGTLRYTAETTRMLRAMKDATIAAPDPEDAGLLRQYGSLTEQPRCLANMPATVEARRVTLLPRVVDIFVETFVRAVDSVQNNSEQEVAMSSPVDEVFEVPDMTCSHCTSTVTKVLQSNGVTVSEIDLDTKKVVAAFPSADVRDRCFDAIRDRGYTVIPPVPS